MLFLVICQVSGSPESQWILVIYIDLQVSPISGSLGHDLSQTNTIRAKCIDFWAILLYWGWVENPTYKAIHCVNIENKLSQGALWVLQNNLWNRLAHVNCYREAPNYSPSLCYVLLCFFKLLIGELVWIDRGYRSLLQLSSSFFNESINHFVHAGHLTPTFVVPREGKKVITVSLLSNCQWDLRSYFVLIPSWFASRSSTESGALLNLAPCFLISRVVYQELHSIFQVYHQSISNINYSYSLYVTLLLAFQVLPL